MKPLFRTANTSILSATLLVVLGVLGCASEDDCLDGKPCRRAARDNDSSESAGSGEENGASSEAPACTVVGKPHFGLGNVDLASQTNVAANTDRRRTKPHTALVTEYARVLGSSNHPTLIEQTGGTFGLPANRWFLEPSASAVLLSTAYNVAFQGCLKLTGDVAGGSADPKYQTPPSSASAKTECATWARKFWSRDASPEEIDACVSVAVTESATETYGSPPNESTRQTTPRRRWAYACASVLTSTGFLSY